MGTACSQQNIVCEINIPIMTAISHDNEMQKHRYVILLFWNDSINNY